MKSVLAFHWSEGHLIRCKRYCIILILISVLLLFTGNGVVKVLNLLYMYVVPIFVSLKFLLPWMFLLKHFEMFCFFRYLIRIYNIYIWIVSCLFIFMMICDTLYLNVNCYLFLLVIFMYLWHSEKYIFNMNFILYLYYLYYIVRVQKVVIILIEIWIYSKLIKYV